MFVASRLKVFFSSYVFRLVGGLSDCFYWFVLLVVFSYFLLLRIPYIFDIGDFFFFLVVFIFPLFLSLMFSRFFSEFRCFIACFVPSGTPLWIAPFVCLAETISYFVRPFVLIIRPFLNLSIGAFGGASLGYMSLKFGSLVLFFLVVLFFYEVFVALVHWFIVCNILSFSVDH
uniref:ATP synthase F0 subunit 6 n=1 Tax=Apharyngostrigea pipientis TaxID=234879 RepID=A0A8A2HA40_9TREM|nr:ATP synthase F0 subunit 6 [Apharyngostrigea pipientis]QSV37701.1 ATP synthase F0 subunit 6 [Apharyngostrigea pipientis]